MHEYLSLSVLVGQTFSNVKMIYNKTELHFLRPDGTGYKFYHEQDCCERVWIEDIDAPLDILENSPILYIDKSTSMDAPSGPIVESSGEGENEYEVPEWTFYIFATAKGHVTIRWVGDSNGYYSVGVDFDIIEKELGC